jgi:hypothetical protein
MVLILCSAQLLQLVAVAVVVVVESEKRFDWWSVVAAAVQKVQLAVL